MTLILIQAIYWFADVLTFLLLARAILSWFARDPYSSIGKIYGITIKITELVVAPCRKLLANFNTGMVDFSVFLAFFLVQIVEKILIKLVLLLF